MDSFKEQIVKKQASGNDKVTKFFIILASIALAFFCFLLVFGTRFSLFGVLFAALALYGGYYFVTKFDVEYEYTFTNGEIDVDKITAQRSRKRLITFRIGAAENFGKVTDDFQIKEGHTSVLAGACDENEQDYFIELNHKDFGETTIIFTPNEEMLELIKTSLPRTLRKSI